METRSNHRISDKWEYIAVIAGNSSSTFYVESLDKAPGFIETVPSDVCGAKTYQLGNTSQGPGNVSMIKVFNYKLDAKEIEKEYYESRYEISLQWNDQQFKEIKDILLIYIHVDSIVDCVLNHCCVVQYYKK